jgi:hypothetical protein
MESDHLCHCRIEFDGRRCNRKASRNPGDNTQYCWQHQNCLYPINEGRESSLPDMTPYSQSFSAPVTPIARSLPKRQVPISSHYALTQRREPSHSVPFIHPQLLETKSNIHDQLSALIAKQAQAKTDYTTQFKAIQPTLLSNVSMDLSFNLLEQSMLNMRIGSLSRLLLAQRPFSESTLKSLREAGTNYHKLIESDIKFLASVSQSNTNIDDLIISHSNELETLEAITQLLK